jgi:perosamine synthetase
MDPERRYYFPIVGHNFRMTNVSAAILCAQIERRDELLASRAHIYARYAERLGQVRGLTLQRAAPETTLCPWLFSVLVDAAVFVCSRDELARRLAAADVETRPFFIPVHQLPPYAALAASQGRTFRASELLGQRGINLPTFSEMTDDDVDCVCSAIEEIAVEF